MVLWNLFNLNKVYKTGPLVVLFGGKDLWADSNSVCFCKNRPKVIWPKLQSWQNKKNVDARFRLQIFGCFRQNVRIVEHSPLERWREECGVGLERAQGSGSEARACLWATKNYPGWMTWTLDHRPRLEFELPWTFQTWLFWKLERLFWASQCL